MGVLKFVNIWERLLTFVIKDPKYTTSDTYTVQGAPKRGLHVWFSITWSFKDW